jgi:hypothetical protein
LDGDVSGETDSSTPFNGETRCFLSYLGSMVFGHGSLDLEVLAFFLKMRKEDISKCREMCFAVTMSKNGVP